MTGLYVPVLAVWSDYIVLIVFGLIWAGGWVIKQVNEQQKKAAAKGGGTSDVSREQRLQQLAARRLAQLRQMAQPDNEPSANIEAAPLVGRARMLHERREEVLQRTQSQAHQARQPTGGGADLAARHAPAAAEVHEATPVRDPGQETAERHRRQQVKRQRSMDRLVRREQELEQVRQRKNAERDARLNTGGSEVDAHAAHRSGQNEVHRLVADTLPGAYAISKRTRSRFVQSLRGMQLRDAIVLKEILGPPKALRQGDELL